MHAEQVDVTTDVVARLVAAQLQRWGGLEVRPLESHGTVNALFRLGDDLVLRFPLEPRVDTAMRDSLVREQDIARRIAACTPLEVPEPLALGEPGEGYAGWWTAYRWIPGEPASAENLDDPTRLAKDLAGFVRALHAMDTGGPTWPPGNRTGPLSTKSDGVRQGLAQSTRLVDVPAVAQAWARCLTADDHAGPDVWIHADLMPGNLLASSGRLTAVIDLGTVGVGDPAVDLMPAWNLFGPQAREAYRHALEVDDATWERGRGWAIVQSTAALPYYVDSNPAMAGTARRTLAAVLE
jgi:aminoglycoside phosphotransferase (APT) family kinase protein